MDLTAPFRFLGALKNLLPHGLSQVPHQRRRAQRIGAALPLQCFTSNQTFEATAVDMSLQGVRLELRRRVAPGTLLSLGLTGSDRRYADVTRVHTRVVWCRRNPANSRLEAGSTYHDPTAVLERSWIKPNLQRLGLCRISLIDQRRSIRTLAVLPARVAGGIKGTLINLSVGGALFETTVDIAPGAELSLEVGPYGKRGTLQCQGRVTRRIRIQDNRYLMGIRFNDAGTQKLDVLGNFLHALLQEGLDRAA